MDFVPVGMCALGNFGNCLVHAKNWDNNSTP